MTWPFVAARGGGGGDWDWELLLQWGIDSAQIKEEEERGGLNLHLFPRQVIQILIQIILFLLLIL